MQKQILDYRVIIEKEKMGRKVVYNAYCPALGVADYGKTIDQAIERITSLIKFHVECLIKEGTAVPVENKSTTVFTTIEIPLPASGKLSLA